ncbi:hypothetical protein Leryth_013129 [Lithospermum erythrorhizon]|uniref:Uncharacterized protein n=1 Tax=Lithospermum erythrorhizon TaxID=34254 RepID=A0AAV3NWH2_LITER|nr:hypothetical protein Leryth_013129 [Lithospermum erythrorhizon]
MSSFEDLLAFLGLSHFRERTQLLSGSFVQKFSESVSNISCATEAEDDGCQGESTAFILKMIGIEAILIAGTKANIQRCRH